MKMASDITSPCLAKAVMDPSTTRIIPPPAVMIEVLNRLLAHEIGAADIYDACLADIPSPATVVIESNQDSHVRRSALLRQVIIDRGGDPTTRADFWGSVTAVLMTGATLLGTNAILALLLKGEDETLAAYRTAVDEVDMPTGDWLRDHCMHEQIHTQRTVHELHRAAQG